MVATFIKLNGRDDIHYKGKLKIEKLKPIEKSLDIDINWKQVALTNKEEIRNIISQMKVQSDDLINQELQVTS